MEFCSGGDVESLLRKYSILSIESTRSYLFQMFFAVYTCREQLALRHFDIKLLNFFITNGSSLLPSHERNMVNHNSKSFSYKRQSKKDILLQIDFGDMQFLLPINSTSLDLVKLSDFGTSFIGTETLNDPITIQQFTTIENTPPEYFILGSVARQAYSADTFCLGLSMLHLMTGDEPYEELLKDIVCPKYLANNLLSIWCKANQSIDNPYYIIDELVKSLDVSDDPDEVYPESSTQAQEQPIDLQYLSHSGAVLFNTLYRYLVLFGNRPNFFTECPWKSNVIWIAICEALEIDVQQTLISKKKKKLRPADVLARSKTSAIFQNDLKLWSIHSGSHQVMQRLLYFTLLYFVYLYLYLYLYLILFSFRARSNLDQLGEGAWVLFDKMTHFDPAMRFHF